MCVGTEGDYAKTDAGPFNVGFDASIVEQEFWTYNRSDKAERDVGRSVGVPLCRRSVCVLTAYTSQNPARWNDL